MESEEVKVLSCRRRRFNFSLSCGRASIMASIAFFRGGLRCSSIASSAGEIIVADQSDALNDRGNVPLHQAVVSTRGHSASNLCPSSEYDGLRPGGGQFYDGLSESPNKASGSERASVAGGPSGVWNPRLPVLCPGGWDQGLSIRPKAGSFRLFFRPRSRIGSTMAFFTTIFGGIPLGKGLVGLIMTGYT